MGLLKQACILLLFLFYSIFPGIAQQGRTNAFDQNEKLGRGVNLGNALEAPTEGEWGVTLQEEYFELIAAKGFNSVRIPIRWSAHAQSIPPFTISGDFFARIDWVIGQALVNGLMVMINMHHYEELFTDPDGEKERFLQMWDQISKRYKDYSDSLVFEILNEPHDQLTAEKWNDLLADAHSVIRSTNPDRTIVVGLAEWGGTAALNKLVLPPDDDNMILTVHFYNPFQFTHQGAEWVDGSNAWMGIQWLNTVLERKQIFNEIAGVIEYSHDHTIPVNLGEFGAYSKADSESRKRWTNYCARLFEENGFSWHYWEFCSGFGIYNAQSDTWNQYLLDALLTLPMPGPSGEDTGDLLYNGDFSNLLAGWYLYVAPQASATASVVNKACKVSITSGGNQDWHVQLMNTGISIEDKQSYHVECELWSSQNRNTWISVGRNSDPWTSYSTVKIISLTSEPTKVTFDFTMSSPSDPSSRFLINLGNAAGTVYVDNVKVVKAGQSGFPLISAPRFSVFPNPVTRECRIEGDRLESVQLFNKAGQQIRSVSCHSGSDACLILTGEPAGIYVLVATDTDGNSGSCKIIKH